MFGKAITYKTTTKCLADNRTAKYEASVGPAENLTPSVRRISKTLNHTSYTGLRAISFKHTWYPGMQLLKG
jgi:hypothetical protein